MKLLFFYDFDKGAVGLGVLLFKEDDDEISYNIEFIILNWAFKISLIKDFQ